MTISQPPNVADSNVSISTSEYQELVRSLTPTLNHVPTGSNIFLQVQTKLEYLALRQALVLGGVDAEALDVLISNNLPTESPSSSSPLRPTRRCGTESDPASASDSSSIVTDDDILQEGRQENRPQTSLSGFIGRMGHSEEADHNNPGYASIQHDSKDRSIVISRLPPKTTLLEVTQVIQGGALLRLFIRRRTRSACVSFVECLDAENFMQYAKQNGVYIKNQRVSILSKQSHPFLTV